MNAQAVENLKGRKVLIVDDEPDVTDLVAYNLRARGVEVQTLNEPEAAIGTAHSFRPDLVILDVMMPRLNGIQICRMLRADPVFGRVPIVFLTARAEEGDRVRGLETGADDYVTKPFSIKELVLRVQALLRRAENAANAATSASVSREGANANATGAAAAALLRAGTLVLDTERHLVTVAGAPVELTATEFKLLHLLMARRGRVQTRDHLLLNVWDYETEIETRTVDTHVRRLRAKLGPAADYIETIRSLGYRFAENLPAPQAAAAVATAAAASSLATNAARTTTATTNATAARLRGRGR